MVRTTKYNLNRVIERAEPEPGGTSGSMRKSVLQEWKQPLFEESGGIQLPRATADIGGTAEIIQLGPLVNEFSPSERIHESFMEAFGFLQNDSASIDLKYKRSSLPIDIDRKQIMGAETILAKIYSNVTNHLAKNEIEDALELLRYSLRSHRDKYGMLHPLVASTLHNIGVVLLFDDQYDTALSYFQQAVRIRIATFGIDHAEVSASRTKLGLIQVSKRDFDNAQVTFSQILHSRRKKLGYNDPQIIKVLNNIACVHYECGGYVAAAKSIEEALETLRKAGTDDNRSQLAMSILLSNHGFILCKRDSYQEACSAYEEASEIQQTIFPANHPTLNRTIQSLGTLWL
jgi:tetratricopeptide (TPR) repeat protein